MSCIFIGGINRSGTTLLQSILCSDRTTNPLIHEASYLRSIVEAYAFGCQQFDEHNKYYFSSLDDLRNFTARWLLEFLNLIRTRYPDARNLVLKHPPLTPRFPTLYELLLNTGEDPRFLLIVRDPRDVAASLVRVGERLRRQGHSEGNTLPRDMTRIGNYFMTSYLPALKTDNQDYLSRVTVIRYEDLVTNPAPIIDRIRAATGLALEEFDAASDWQRNKIDLAGLKAADNAWLSSLWGRGLSRSRVGTYRDTLTTAEIEVLERVCAGPMRTFGYL
jgi:hypothetical protein